MKRKVIMTGHEKGWIACNECGFEMAINIEHQYKTVEVECPDCGHVDEYYVAPEDYFSDLDL